MAYDKVIDSSALDAGMTATANAIRKKTGGSSPIVWDHENGFKAAVEVISTGSGGGGGVTLPELGDSAAQPSDMAENKVLYDDEGNPVTGKLSVISSMQITAGNTEVGYNGTSVYVTGKRNSRAIVEAGSTLRMDVSADKFGNVQQHQVLEGTTFTSSNGINLPGTMKITGGGVTLPTLTNPGAAGDLVEGKELIGQTGNIVVGTIPQKTYTDITIDGSMVTVPAGYYEAACLKSIPRVSLASPSISEVDDSGKITASVTQTAGYVSAETKKTTKQLAVLAENTYTPGTVDYVLFSGQYLTGKQTIKGDANLVPANIKQGVSIFGVSGSYTGSGGGGGSTTAGVATFTLGSDVSTAGTFVKLGNVPWIAEHINDENLYVDLIRLNTTTTNNNSIFNVVSCNTRYVNGYYGIGLYKQTYMNSSNNFDVSFNDTTDTNCIRLCGDSNGDVYIAAYNSYFFAAGNYALLYGLI